MNAPSARATATGAAMALLGAAAILSVDGDALPRGEAPGLPALRLATGGVLLLLGLATALSALGGRNKGAGGFRLNHFLPFLRRRRKGEPPSRLERTGAALKTTLPAAWFSDYRFARPGTLRKGLKWIGVSLLSAPLRRLIQALCLAVFLWSFFHVCWPYSAAPEPPGRIARGWTVDSVDQSDGRVRLSAPADADRWPAVVETVHLVLNEGDASALAAFRSTMEDSGRLELTPAAPLGPEAFNRLLLHVAPVALHERAPDAWPSHHADNLARKERLAAELFLVIDPLVSLSTAIASRNVVWSLVCAALILIVCVAIPRGFCGYLCPLGTTIDLFDRIVGKRIKRFRVADRGWWVHTKYWLLATVLICALGGVLISGFVAAIPVITRGALFLGEPLQTGMLRDWRLVAPMNAGHFISIALFLGVLFLGLLRPRFWCKYVCPSGAVFSVANLFRVSERKVETSCVNCNKCVEVCPFDAIKPDFTTRTADCTLCQTCGGVCPTHAIKFVERWNATDLKPAEEPATDGAALERRRFLSLAAAATAVASGGGAAAAIRGHGARLEEPGAFLPVRPPGSAPEQEFLQMCIRCGECFKACPNNVLQSQGFEQGVEGLWTPRVVADWAGCESSCNACGQVCPTGAIRPLPLEEKKAARMGLAIVDETACLPYADREACQLCVDECVAAGYDAIEFTQVHTRMDENGAPLEGTGFVAPVVLAEKCVGCGLCQTRCHGINVKEKGLLQESAIVISAGPGREDRILSGSYIELREREARTRGRENAPGADPEPANGTPATIDADDPFGLNGI